MAKNDSTRSSSAIDVLNDVDTRQQIFDIRALGNSAYALLDNPDFDHDDQADVYRLVRMILETSDSALTKINKAEKAVFSRKGGAA